MSKTKILIAEDNQMFRLGLVSLLEKSDEVEVLATAENGKEIIELSKLYRPEVILMDIELPLIRGTEACHIITQDNPQAKILALSHDNNEQTVVDMIQAGALGYLLKEASLDELNIAIDALKRGSNYFSKQVSIKLFARLGSTKAKSKIKRTKGITIREREILEFVADELSNQEIAERLYISPRTVETHKRNLIQKLNVKNTIGLVKYYLLNYQQIRGNTA